MAKWPDDIEQRCRERENAARERYEASLRASPDQLAFEAAEDEWLRSHRAERLK